MGHGFHGRTRISRIAPRGDVIGGADWRDRHFFILEQRKSDSERRDKGLPL
jgi:hypothetical protein